MLKEIQLAHANQGLSIEYSPRRELVIGWIMAAHSNQKTPRKYDFEVSWAGGRNSEVITHAGDAWVQALTVLRMVAKELAPVRRAVSTTVRIAASPSAAHIAR